jgi:hypothetical protein
MTTQQAIEQALRRGPRTVTELVAATGASQPTVARTLGAMEHVVTMRIPNSRAPVHGIIDGLPGQPPLPYTVYRVQAQGEIFPIGRIMPIIGADFWYENLEDPSRSRTYESLPWFMQDLRPQGFLGRATALDFSTRGWPSSLDLWTDRHVLAALVQSNAHDHIGNLIIGDRSADTFRFQRQNPFRRALPAHAQERLTYYIHAVDAAGTRGGSSVHGEQPKFCADVEIPNQPGQVRSLLVKFSAPLSEGAGQRWSDLLRMESRALSAIALRLGIPAARNEIQFDGTRTYLEVERFDRERGGGRVGVISFSSLDAEYVGLGQGWRPVAEQLITEGHLAAEALPVIAQLNLFADLIGNSDQHLVNISVLFNGQRPMTLTPVYDFLPMRYAPTSTGTNSEPLSFTAVFQRHQALERDIIRNCLDAAIEFWQQNSEDAGISEEMRALSSLNAARLRELA